MDCLNDALDAGPDSRRPRKRRRPIPSGRVSARSAPVASAALAACGLGLGAVPLPGRLVLFAARYAANSVTCRPFPKRRVIVDAMSIAIGFVSRPIAGGEAIGVVASSFILLCGFSLTPLPGVGKRRLEFTPLEAADAYRANRRSYSREKIDVLLPVSSSLGLLPHALYTTAPATIRVHRTEDLIYTIPPDFYGIFRRIFKVQEGRRDGPSAAESTPMHRPWSAHHLIRAVAATAR